MGGIVMSPKYLLQHEGYTCFFGNTIFKIIYNQ